MRENGLILLPKGFQLDAYVQVFNNPMIVRGYMNTIIVVLVSLVFNITLTSIGAYVASRKNAYFSKWIMIMMVFTMYFSGGMIPTYFNITDLNLIDTYWSLILPTAINTFNLIIMKSAFENIPVGLEDASKIDGAGNFRILFQIFLPVSKASLSVIMLYYAVSHWNSWFNAMLYLNRRELFPLQLILREILVQDDTASMVQGVSVSDKALISEIVKYAVIIVSTIPILCIYPFIQKHFARGIMIGAVKG
jgi:putative aldouronate transport system permease protein